MTKPTGTAVTSGGDTMATATLAGVTGEVQAVIPTGPDGYLIGSRPDYLLWFPPTANAANKIIGDVYNTGTVPIRIRGLWMVPNMAAVTGAPIDWIVGRTSAVGTGGTGVTPAQLDTNQGSWPAAATARSAPTGGATASTVLFNIYTLNEETNAAFGLLPYTNMLPQLGDRVIEIVLNQNQGMAVRQSATANTVGSTGMLLLATYDD
jgi:hypothetical protein